MDTPALLAATGGKFDGKSLSGDGMMVAIIKTGRSTPRGGKA